MAYKIKRSAFKPSGRLSYSAFSGIETGDVNYGVDDKIKIRAYRPSGDTIVYGKVSQSKIRYNSKGEPYFNHRGQRVYLNEIMRVNY